MFKKTAILALLTVFLASFSLQTSFLDEQKKYERVRTAIKEKKHVIKNKLNDNGLELNNFNVLFIAYKNSNDFDVYAKKTTDTGYEKIRSYDICASSGHLGPKERQGDLQIPEGFYHIDHFNPASSYYLSLRINYPNKADRINCTHSDPGGNIFIHGNCATIGCIPMTDDKIKEIYLYAVYAKNNGQTNIPVYIFPFKMDNRNFLNYQKVYKKHNELTEFWNILKLGYNQFMKTKSELEIKVDTNGNYIF